ncbi:response regulator transcription factor [Cohnella candidum]|uniref:Response regulator n=1 Tax=Cohnella candidum TaxID=2674991 RepID=A0A3G3JTP5_9BACL|nr:response regulator [Cohnella candidum]AYQ71595.1 response regulator [Cohnella candidum]
MATLLLVDDEPRQVRSLAAIIGRQRPAYRVLEATDAESAWDIIEAEHVDAVLTDIRMPEVDGLTLIERIVRRKPHIKTVLISGYGQFDYAKQAIEHRVVEYLVKPIGLPEIDRMLVKLDELFTAETSLKQSFSVYAEHLWNSLISGSLNDSQRQELESRIPTAGAGIAMVFDPGVGSPEESTQRKMNELLSAMGPSAIFRDTASGSLVSFAWLDRPLAARPSETVSKVVRLFEKLRADGMEDAALGVSTIRADLSRNLKAAYDEAVLALRHRFYAHGEPILWATDVRPFTGTVKPASQELAEPLTLAVKAGDRKRAMELIRSFFQAGETPPYPDPERLKEELNLILWQLTEGLRHRVPPETKELSFAENKSLLAACGDYQELRYRFKKLVDGWLELAGKAHQDKNGILVLQCQAYLQQHYKEEISLESVAAMFHFNPSYFSNLFKSKAGVNFSEYLIDLRIREAKAILDNGEHKIADVSAMVGFRDAAYFNKMFKRKTGISPNAYRQMNGRK